MYIDTFQISIAKELFESIYTDEKILIRCLLIKVRALISTSIEIKSIHEINTDTKQTQTQRYKSKTLKDIKLHKIH